MGSLQSRGSDGRAIGDVGEPKKESLKLGGWTRSTPKSRFLSGYHRYGRSILYGIERR